MARNKKSFVLYTDYRQHIALLSDAERGQLLMAMLDYSETREMPELSGAPMMAFSFIRAQMERDEEKWEKTRSARSAAGRSGSSKSGKAGAGKEEQAETKAQGHKQTSSNGNKVKQTLTKGNKSKQTQTKEAVTVTVTDTVNVTDTVTVTDTVNVTDTVTVKNNPPVSPLSGGKPPQEDEFCGKNFSDAVKDKVREWRQYKQERRESYKPTGWKSLMSEIQNNLDRYGESAVLSLISRCIASGYKGILFDQLAREAGRAAPEKSADRPAQNRFVNFQQRGVDYNELARQALQRRLKGEEYDTG